MFVAWGLFANPLVWDGAGVRFHGMNPHRGKKDYYGTLGWRVFGFAFFVWVFTVGIIGFLKL